jgi:cephalosporin hydroxylase
MLELLGGERQVIGVDIDIRSHNREQIESHPMSKHIRLVQGSSIAEDTLNQVKSLIGEGKRILVVLDSNHTHSHVLAELHLYSRFVCKDSYVVVLILSLRTCLQISFRPSMGQR